MLTIEEIKKELDAGENVELEYLGGISSDGHAGEYAGFLKYAGTVVVDGFENGCLNIKNTWYVINDENLKHFRIKRPTPTFDDLIDVVIKAVKDKVINLDFMSDSALEFHKRGYPDYKYGFESADDIKEAIEVINSLYTETFVIEHASDMRRIKRTAIIVLENDYEVCAESDCLHHGVNYIQITYGGINFNLSFVSLKGATVTQKRGCNNE